MNAEIEERWNKIAHCPAVLSLLKLLKKAYLDVNITDKWRSVEKKAQQSTVLTIEHRKKKNYECYWLRIGMLMVPDWNATDAANPSAKVNLVPKANLYEEIGTDAQSMCWEICDWQSF